MRDFLFLLLFCLACGCSTRPGIDKHVHHADNVVDVKELVKEIVIDTPLVGGAARPYVLGDYFILADGRSSENQVLVFDKKDFSYVAGAGQPGMGPNEITNLGELMTDAVHRRLYVADYGKMQLLGYDLDSILTHSADAPAYRLEMGKGATPVMLAYVNDTLCYACSITVEPGKHFQQSVVAWNVVTGEMHPLISGHPEIERQRIRYAVSMENDLIAVSYDHHDLLATYDLRGNLKHYVYGPHWDNATSNATVYYYGSIVICKDRIVVGYSGERTPDIGGIGVSKLLVYDLEGNYIRTLNVGYNIGVFCYDPTYNRIIMVLDDEIQFAYLNLDNLL